MAMPGMRGRQHLPPDRLPLGRAQRHRALADRRRAPRGSPRAPAMITTGRTSRPSVRPPARRTAEPERAAHEERQAEDAVDDRGHRGQVLDVDLDQAVPPALAVGVFLEVDRGGDADGHDEAAHTTISQSVPSSAGARPAFAGNARRVVGEEVELDSCRAAVDDDVDEQHHRAVSKPTAEADEQGHAEQRSLICSDRRDARSPRRRAIGASATRSFVDLPVLADEADRDRVDDQRDHEEQRSRPRRSVLYCDVPVGIRPWRSPR